MGAGTIAIGIAGGILLSIFLIFMLRVIVGTAVKVREHLAADRRHEAWIRESVRTGAVILPDRANSVVKTTTKEE